MLKMTMLRL